MVSVCYVAFTTFFKKAHGRLRRDWSGSGNLALRCYFKWSGGVWRLRGITPGLCRQLSGCLLSHTPGTSRTDVTAPIRVEEGLGEGDKPQAESPTHQHASPADQEENHSPTCHLCQHLQPLLVAGVAFR